MDPFFRCDRSYLKKRKEAGCYQLGDERPKQAHCCLCAKIFVTKRGEVRDAEEAKTMVRCKACIEREERYRDYLKEKDA